MGNWRASDDSGAEGYGVAVEEALASFKQHKELRQDYYTRKVAAKGAIAKMLEVTRPGSIVQLLVFEDSGGTILELMQLLAEQGNEYASIVLDAMNEEN